MVLDPNRRLQSVYVPVGDGVRLAVDVWLPVGKVAAGETVGAVVRTTRYHRAEEPPRPGPEFDTNRAEGELWNTAGFAFVVADARGTGASFGVRTSELGEREIADFGELIDWVATRPWSNGRVGAFGTSYEGQAAELVARLGDPHLIAVAALFSPNDPYRQLFYPGGAATAGRFARWMGESRLKDGVIGARERLAGLRGLPPESIEPSTPVKPVDGPDGRALLAEAVAEHQSNTDVHELMDRVPFHDDRVEGLDWAITTPAAAYEAIAATGVPLLVRVGWVDGAFVTGALTRFATLPNHQTVEIGPWGHGGRTHADPLRPVDPLDGSGLAAPEGQDRRLVEFFARYLGADPAPPAGHGTLTYSTLGTDRWRTVDAWPPEDVDVHRLHPGPAGELADGAGSGSTVRYAVDPGSTTGPTNRWLAGEIGRGAAYPDRREADETLLTFTSAPLSADLHLLGFPVATLRLATSGTDGVVYVYLEDIGPDGSVTYLTEGCLRFLQRATSGPAAPTGLGVPRSFARADRLPVEPGADLDLVVELLPVSALLRAGDRIRIAIAGHDASCFSYHGPPGETFTLTLGDPTHLDLPVLRRPG
ncbi:CocE/NonD family hydrolase [Pseudonocardia humida]|uniref:CocE/NonD family hydrolase n=1 Tax=Pseudonocardia humida TaxID=2800819 RepID=A0ABT1A8N1_9PSEU|nr:CocE/NonD family hydrolase [Pseudonocardia humida]MCO1659395.1 CocE/NonD family hydrolase [Pseudonocardia humida]